MTGPLLNLLNDLPVFGLSAFARIPARLFGRPQFALRLDGGHRLWIRTRSSDLAVARQVFVAGDYDFTDRPQFARLAARHAAILRAGRIPLIIDAGANIGASALWFARLFPGSRLVLIEPDPANAACARDNVAALPDASVIEAAIGARAGRVRIVDDGSEDWALRTERHDDDGGIRIVTIPEILDAADDAELLLAKIDIEGFEEDLFSANIEWIDRASAIIIEPHDWMFPRRGTSRNFRRCLDARDFELLISGENLIFVRAG
jgi:FkbM family methyltransferase